MKKVIFGFILMISVAFVSEAVFAQKGGAPQSIGVIDMETVLKEMPEAVQADAMLKDLQKKYQDSLVAISNDFQKRVEAYQKQQAMMPADKKAKEEEDLKAQEQVVLKYREDKYNEIAQRRDQALEPIRAKIKKAVEVVAKEENLSLVINKLNELVLYVEDKNDITYRVIDRIKRGGVK